MFVDLIGRGQPRRAVADCAGDAALSGVLADMQLGAAPLIRSAVQRQTPVIEARDHYRQKRGRPCVRFVELSFLSRIADLVGVAAKRLRCG